jgi:hypothetical protein
VLKRDEPIDVLVVAPFVQRPVDGNAAKLQYIEAGKPRARKCRNHSVSRDPQALMERVRSFRQVNGNCDDGTRGQMSGNIGLGFRLGHTLVEAAPPDGANRVALQPLLSVHSA